MNTDPDEDPEPALFEINLQDANKNIIKKKRFSAYYFWKVHLHLFFKVKKSKRSHKTVGINVFRTILLDDRRID
jgi:hypothetical protein